MQIDRGIVDTAAMDFTPTIERDEDFLFMPPFALDNEVITVSS